MEEEKKFKIDWTIHGVTDDDGSVSYHTHGLDNHGMLELELNLNIEPRRAMEIINYIAYNLIKDNRIIKEEAMLEKIFTCPIYLKKTKAIHTTNKFNMKTDILRIILPDDKLRFPWDKGCSKEYKSQY